MALHVALQNGFLGEEVALSVNGEEVFRGKEVKTRVQIGLAEAIDIDVGSGQVTIETSIPARDISERLEIILSKPVFLGVSIDPEDGIRYLIQHRPFRYM